MGTPFEYPGPASQRLARLKNRTAELERELSDARGALSRELAHVARGRPAEHDVAEATGWVPRGPRRQQDLDAPGGSGGGRENAGGRQSRGRGTRLAAGPDQAGRGAGIAAAGGSTVVYERMDAGWDGHGADGAETGGYQHGGYARGLDVTEGHPAGEYPAYYPGQGAPAADGGEYVDDGYTDDGYDGDGYTDDGYAGPDAAGLDDARADQADGAELFEERTEALVNGGRRGGRRGAMPVAAKAGIAGTLAAAAITIVALALSGSGASWPPSMATVQRESATACQNPDVKAEPSQINFACARATRQILWVFALLTSRGNPAFSDAKTGRTGLEPITPALGGEIAWSLNLHHPYDPANPVDSLEVAARAINNIVGGATLTGSHGNPVVQPGLESSPANCSRYTGSPAIVTRKGFPPLCARPVTSPGGQAALVSDVYRKWIVGATRSAARDAAVLFENAKNPGDPQVQDILRQLSHPKT